MPQKSSCTIVDFLFTIYFLVHVIVIGCVFIEVGGKYFPFRFLFGISVSELGRRDTSQCLLIVLAVVLELLLVCGWYNGYLKRDKEK